MDLNRQWVDFTCLFSNSTTQPLNYLTRSVFRSLSPVSRFLIIFISTFPAAEEKLLPPNPFPQSRPFWNIGFARGILHHFINSTPVIPPLNAFPGTEIFSNHTIEQVNKDPKKEYSQHGQAPIFMGRIFWSFSAQISNSADMVLPKPG